jgi:hypothetical protein
MGNIGSLLAVILNIPRKSPDGLFRTSALETWRVKANATALMNATSLPAMLERRFSVGA